ncbi:MAG: hypothetical protein JXQ90_10410 [Cyclobacteriaceae bacterium]
MKDIIDLSKLAWVAKTIGLFAGICLLHFLIEVVYVESVDQALVETKEDLGFIALSAIAVSLITYFRKRNNAGGIKEGKS